VLAAEQRLRRRDDFAAAIRGGRRAGRGAVVVYLRTPRPGVDLELETRDASPARAGFVVPRTVGGAVVRNQVRRRLRHLVRDRLGLLPPGALLVVRALPGAADRSFRRLAADLDAALDAVRPPVVR
jgi:ribonuclease P protein component